MKTEISLYCWQQYEIFYSSKTVQRKHIIAFRWQIWALLYCLQLLAGQQQSWGNVLLYFNSDSDCTNSPYHYVIRRLSVVFVGCVWNLMAHGDVRLGKWRGNWRKEWVASTLTILRNVVYPALLTLMRTPRLPAVDWTDAPAVLNGLVRFGERRNWFLRVCHHFSNAVYIWIFSEKSCNVSVGTYQKLFFAWQHL